MNNMPLNPLAVQALIAVKVAGTQSHSLREQALIAYQTKQAMESMLSTAEHLNKRAHSVALTKSIWAVKCALKDTNRVLEQYEKKQKAGGIS